MVDSELRSSDWDGHEVVGTSDASSFICRNLSSHGVHVPIDAGVSISKNIQVLMYSIFPHPLSQTSKDLRVPMYPYSHRCLIED